MPTRHSVRKTKHDVIPHALAESGRERDLTMLMLHHERNRDRNLPHAATWALPYCIGAQADVRSLSCPPSADGFGMTSVLKNIQASLGPEQQGDPRCQLFII